MDLEHRLHPSEATLQSRVLAREFLDSRILDLALSSPLDCGEPDPRNLIPLATPTRQERRVQSFSTQKRSHIAIALAGIRFTQYPQSAVKRRRFACSLTSGSGATTASRRAGSTVALPAPSDPAKFVFSVNRLIHDPPPPSTLISRGGVSQACWHGGHLNFTTQLGLGVMWFHKPRLAYSLEYRVQHLSNNSLSTVNPGINSSYIQFGIRVSR